MDKKIVKSMNECIREPVKRQQRQPYGEILNSPIFSMSRKRNSKQILICDLLTIVDEMVINDRIEIWKKVSGSSSIIVLGAGAGIVNSTPKLRRMMRR